MKFNLFCGISIFLIGCFASIQTIKELDAKFNGDSIEAVCLETPKFCTRSNNRIKIEYRGIDYSVLIGRNECSSNHYKVNSKYSFLHSNNFDHMITAKGNPEIMIPILLLIFGLGIYSFWKMKKATNKR